MNKIILTASILLSQALMSTLSYADSDYLAKRTAEINKHNAPAVSNTCHTVWWAYQRSTFPAAFASSDGLNGDAPRTQPQICWSARARVLRDAEETALNNCNRAAMRYHRPACKLVGSHS